MSFSLLYWIILLLWVILSAWVGWYSPTRPSLAWPGRGYSLILLVLLILLGWKVFGAPVHP